MGMIELNGQQYLNGRASDPRELGWMRGAPPPKEKRITSDLGSYLSFPQIRWSLSHMRELIATVNVWRGPGLASRLERADRTDEIDALLFEDGAGRRRRFDEALYDTYVDGIVVLHRGRIVYERYFGVLEPHMPHACHSVTKSYAGTLAAAFVHEGVLDDSKTIAYYLPELRDAAWGDATLRQVMDMRTGLAYTEVYDDESSGVWAYYRACGAPLIGYDGPQTLCDYLCTVRKQGGHGEAFAYKTVNSEVMGWVMARATGRSFAQLLHERLWAPLGCEEDGFVSVDSAGMQRAGGGMSATLRDMARFGELMRREGEWNGKQLIPASVVHDVQQALNPAKFASDISYRSQWWVQPNHELGAFEAAGVHGQRIHIAPKAEMVVARFSSHPVASAAAAEPVQITAPQMLALGRMLRT